MFVYSLSLSLFQEKDLRVDQEASFAVQRNGARGVIDAKVHSPSGVVEECYITDVDAGESGIGVSFQLMFSYEHKRTD